MTPTAFPFAFDRRLRPLARLFLIHPETCTFVVDDERAVVVFGRWRLSVALTNIASVEVSGPYAWWKVAGPPHVSLRDRGATFATTTRAGICMQLVDPIAAIDPFAFIRHPGVTVTVEEPERVTAFLRAAISSCSTTPPSELEPHRAWPYRRGRRIAAFRAWRRWRRRSIDTMLCLEADAPPHAGSTVPATATHADAPDVQALDDGVGGAYCRRYLVDVDTDLGPEAAMRPVQDDMNVLSDPRLAPINKLAGEIGHLRVGDRLVVALAGPWSGPVRVVDVTPTSFRLGTLAGHLEAGEIEFRVVAIEHGVRFEIESWARSGGPFMRVLYDGLGVARSLQAEMWVEACEAFAVRTGRQIGPVHVVTERIA